MDKHPLKCWSIISKDDVYTLTVTSNEVDSVQEWIYTFATLTSEALRACYERHPDLFGALLKAVETVLGDPYCTRVDSPLLPLSFSYVEGEANG